MGIYQFWCGIYLVSLTSLFAFYVYIQRYAFADLLVHPISIVIVSGLSRFLIYNAVGSHRIYLHSILGYTYSQPPETEMES